MLKDHEESRKSESVQQRKRHARILKEYVLDNPEFSALSDKARSLIITTVSSFYNYCELPLTTSKGEFKFEIYAKYDYRQPGLDAAWKIPALCQDNQWSLISRPQKKKYWSSMVKLIFYGGVNEIGGNKILQSSDKFLVIAKLQISVANTIIIRNKHPKRHIWIKYTISFPNTFVIKFSVNTVQNHIQLYEFLMLFNWLIYDHFCRAKCWKKAPRSR